MRNQKPYLFWLGVLVSLSVTLACLGSGDTRTEWNTLSGEGFSFSYPANWNFVTMRAAGEGYALYMPGRTSGTNIVVLRNPSTHTDLAELEQKLIAELDKPQFASGEIVEITYIPLDNREAVRVHIRAVLNPDQQEMEGIQVGTLLPDGQALMISLGIFNPRDFNAATEVFEKVLESVRFDP